VSLPVEHRVLRPVRDRPTWIAYAQLSFWAWFLYAFGATQALLRDEQGTTKTVAAFHGTALAIGGLIAGLLTATVIEHRGRGWVLRMAGLTTAGALIVYTWPGAALPVSLTGAFLASFLGTFLIISINAFLLDHQRLAGPAALTEANALASCAGLLAPLAVGLGAATVLGWRSGVLVVVVALVVIEIWRGGSTADFGTRGLAAHEDAPTRLPRRIAWSLGVVMCTLGIEFCLTFWGADLLRERCGFGPAAAAASIAAITGGMLVGRLIGARLAQRMSTELMLRISMVIALVAFLVAWTSTIGAVVLAGLTVTGIGIGVHWPLSVSRVVRHSGGMTDRAAAAASIAGSVAMAIAPITLGALADAIGFHLAFLLVPALLVLALLLLVLRPVPDPA
jgi:fucose permease